MDGGRIRNGNVDHALDQLLGDELHEFMCHQAPARHAWSSLMSVFPLMA